MVAKQSHRAKPWTGDTVRTDLGFAAITDFFKAPPPPPQPGRPAGLPIKKRGRQPAVATSPTPSSEGSSTTPPQPASTASGSGTDSPINGKRAAATLLGVKLKRTNWSMGDPLERLEQSVADWDAKTGSFLLENSEMNMKNIAKLVHIPYNTFYDYAKPDKGKRKEVGSHVGNKPLFDDDSRQFVVDVIRRRDRGNDGLNRRECIDTMHDLKPECSRRAMTQTFDRTVRPQNNDVLTGIIKANPTTVKRTAITVAQQWRWHTTVEHALTFLRQQNTGLTPDGKTFGEVIHYSLLATRYSLLTTHYSLLTTCYSLLTTHYSLLSYTVSSSE